MNWIWVIIIAAVLGGIIGYMSSGKKEEAVSGAVGAGLGCLGIILRIFFAFAVIYLILKLGAWLFGFNI